ncbi:hypothetical protein [Burkholderia gladioli]
MWWPWACSSGALVAGGDTSVMNTLLVALKSFFDAYGYALSLS